jgi:hypothetical protein
MKKGKDKTRFQINNVVTTQMHHFLLRRHQLIKVTADQITENLTPRKAARRFPITVVASINHQTRRRLSDTSRKRRVASFCYEMGHQSFTRKMLRIAIASARPDEIMQIKVSDLIPANRYSDLRIKAETCSTNGGLCFHITYYLCLNPAPSSIWISWDSRIRLPQKRTHAPWCLATISPGPQKRLSCGLWRMARRQKSSTRQPPLLCSLPL